MSNLQHRQQKIQAKRKQTPWREFVMEICSWFPFALYKNNNITTPYNSTIHRIAGVVDPISFDLKRNSITIDWKWDMFSSLQEALSQNYLAGNKVIGQNENADFSYIILGVKNSYLSLVVVDSQNVIYTYNSFFSKDIYNSILIQNSQQVFSSRIISNSDSIFYSSNIDQSNNLRFCANMIGCSECIGCVWLINQSHLINNIQYTKEEYSTIKKEMLQEKGNFYHKHANTFNIIGSNIWEIISWSFNKLCSRVENGFMNYQLINARNVVFCNWTNPIEHVMDCCSIWGIVSDHIYASMWVWFECHHVYCSAECSPQCSNIYYSYLLDTCSFCLGCIGLKNKSYCILNKQYSKEERYDRVDEIFSQMEKDGTLGDFFPATMNPFYFNDTAAYLIDPSFTREEVIAKWYLWRDEVIKVDIPADAQIVSTSDLDQYEGYDADGKRTINPSILDKVIQDPQGNVYKIVKMELAFLIKHGLPLPRKHWLDRMKENFRIG
jgi:hypothetical protein